MVREEALEIHPAVVTRAVHAESAATCWTSRLGRLDPQVTRAAHRRRGRVDVDVHPLTLARLHFMEPGGFEGARGDGRRAGFADAQRGWEDGVPACEFDATAG